MPINFSANDYLTVVVTNFKIKSHTLLDVTVKHRGGSGPS